MNWKERDYYRWRKRFAWRPLKFNGQWIWLERYQYRNVRRSEIDKLYPGMRDSFWPAWFEEFRFAGRSVFRQTKVFSPMGSAHKHWLVAPKPNRLRVVK